MKKSHLFIFSIFILFLSVPWIFYKPSAMVLFGMPIWAVYSLVITFLYAGIIFYFIGKYWQISAEKTKT